MWEGKGNGTWDTTFRLCTGLAFGTHPNQGSCSIFTWNQRVNLNIFWKYDPRLWIDATVQKNSLLYRPKFQTLIPRLQRPSCNVEGSGSEWREGSRILSVAQYCMHAFPAIVPCEEVPCKKVPWKKFTPKNALEKFPRKEFPGRRNYELVVFRSILPFLKLCHCQRWIFKPSLILRLID